MSGAAGNMHSLKAEITHFARVFEDRETRVTAHTLSGIQVGLAGMGEGDNALTFPACFCVNDALLSPHWVKVVTGEEELPASVQPGDNWRQNNGPWQLRRSKPDRWVTPLGFQPKAIMPCKDDGAQSVPLAPTDPIGLRGTDVTVLEQAAETIFEDKECCDLADVETPPTPPPAGVALSRFCRAANSTADGSEYGDGNAPSPWKIRKLQDRSVK